MACYACMLGMHFVIRRLINAALTGAAFFSPVADRLIEKLHGGKGSDSIMPPLDEIQVWVSF